jgi:hypothetical protein
MEMLTWKPLYDIVGGGHLGCAMGIVRRMGSFVGFSSAVSEKQAL